MQIKSMTLIGGLLAQVVITGTVFFIVMIINMLRRKTKTNIQKVAKIFFISTIIGGEISCSGLHWLAPFWYGFFLFALSNGNGKLEEKKSTVIN